MATEDKELMYLIMGTALSIVGTWLGKDKIAEAWSTRVNGKIAEKKTDSDIKIAEKDSAIQSFERAIKTLNELVEIKKEEAHDCNERLKDMADRMSTLEQTVELYRKRVTDLEARYGAA